MGALLDRAVRPVLPPAAYTVPGGAVDAADTAALKTLLANSEPQVIRLTGSAYDDTTPISVTKPHQIYAASLGSATFTCGLDLTTAACDGAVLQGMAFDVTDSTKCHASGSPSRGSVIAVRLSAANPTFQDITIDGNRDQAADIGNGINVNSTGAPGTIRRVSVTQLLRNGIRITRSLDEQPHTDPWYLDDLDASYIGETTRRSAAGAAEFGFWIGEKFVGYRWRTRKTAWSGVWFGDSCSDSTLYDLDANEGWHPDGDSDGEGQGQGFYCERYTNNLTLIRGRIGPMFQTAIACEGIKDSASNQGKASTDGLLVDYFVLGSGWYGVVAQNGKHTWVNGPDAGQPTTEGSTRITCRNSIIHNQRKCCLNDDRNDWGDSRDNFYDVAGNTYLAHPDVVARGIYDNLRTGLSEIFP